MTSPYLNTFEVAQYLRILDAEGRPNPRAALKFIDAHVAPEFVRRRGRSVLVHRDGLEAALPQRRPA